MPIDDVELATAHDHDVVVVVHDDNAFDFFRPDRRQPRPIGELHLEHRPDTDPIRLVNRGAVQHHLPCPDEFHNSTPRQSEHARHGGINPLAVQSLRDEQDLALSHERSGSDHDHRRPQHHDAQAAHDAGQ